MGIFYCHQELVSSLKGNEVADSTLSPTERLVHLRWSLRLKATKLPTYRTRISATYDEFCDPPCDKSL
jgi:hypothetical protein